MTVSESLFFLQFSLRTDMYAWPLDRGNVTSFVHGYEAGRSRCNFTRLLRQRLTMTYAISYSNDGWPGQVARFAHRRAWSWIAAFKHLALEVVAADKPLVLTGQCALVRKWLLNHLNYMKERNATWLDSWVAVCAFPASWFLAMWSAEEWALLVALNEQLTLTGSSEKILQFKISRLNAQLQALAGSAE